MLTRFAELLREHRLRLGFSQEALAEAARISASSIGLYERGIHTAPHRDTVMLLANALQLHGSTRADFEAAARRAPRAAVPKRHSSARRDNLPSHVTSFVGREAETSRTSELLRRHRIVSLTGSGGIGKTRLALHTASQLSSEYPDGLWFIDFSAIAEASQVLRRVALVLQIPFPNNGDIEELIEGFSDRKQLLVFDNCEHLIRPIADLAAAIVRTTTNTTILTTSRERLRITGEAVSRIPPLPVPIGLPDTLVDAQSFSGVMLFMDRAQAVVPEFAFSRSRMETVVAICRRLEGIPLAIELAAARLASLSLAEIRDKLSDRFATLSMGPRDVAPRQQTLLATIAWSYDLLDERERSILRTLSIFPASFTLSSSVAVCDPTLKEAVVVDIVSSLADKSFLVIEPSEHEQHRYVMLDSTRDYVRRVRDADEIESDMARLGDWCASFAATCERERFAMSTESWVAIVRPEFESISVALDWALKDAGRSLIAGRIVGCLRAYWVLIGRANELAGLADELLVKISATESPVLAARLMISRYNTGSGPNRRTDLFAAHALFTSAGDHLGLMFCNLYLADYLSNDESSEALRAIEEAERFAKLLDLPRVFLSTLELRVMVFAQTGRYPEAKDAVIELIRRCEALGEVRLEGRAKMLLAGVAFRLDGVGRAVQIVREVVAMGTKIGADEQGHALSILSQFLAIQGEDEEARNVGRTVLLDPSLRAHRYLPRVILSIAALAARHGQAPAAARLFGFYRVNALADLERSDAAAALREKLVIALQEALPVAEIEAHCVAGEELSTAAVMDEALLA